MNDWQDIKFAPKIEGKILQGYSQKGQLGVWPILWTGGSGEVEKVTALFKGELITIEHKGEWKWFGIKDDKNILSPPLMFSPMMDPPNAD